jgi:hypothetical protein
MTIFKLLCAITLAASVSAAQTKLSGAATCPATPSESHAIEVGDHSGHAYTIVKGGCTWTKPMEIAGTQTKEDTGTGFDEISGTKSGGNGYVIGTWTKGDKSYVRTQGSATLKDGTIESAEGT